METLWTAAHQDPLSMRILQARTLVEEVPSPPPGDLPNPGIQPGSLTSPVLAAGFFTTSTTWEAPITVDVNKSIKSKHSEIIRKC